MKRRYCYEEKMIEMDRNIQLRSEELGYKTFVLLMAVWALFNCWQSLAMEMDYNVLPIFVLCLSLSVQNFSQLGIKQKMVSSDEDYKEPNRLVQTIILTVFFIVIILSIGTYFALKG